MVMLGDSSQRRSRYLTDLQLLIVGLLVISVAYETGLFTGARMTAFGQCIEGVNAPIMRFTRTVLCAVLALIFWRKRGVSPGLPNARRAGLIDRALLGVAFALSVVADFFIILMPELLDMQAAPVAVAPPLVPTLAPDANPSCLVKEAGWPFLVGTGLFMGVHALLIARHALGWKAAWQTGPDYRRKLLWSALGVYIPGAVFLWKVAPALGRGGNDLLEQVYFLVLLTGLWMAIGTLFRGAFPRTNALLIVIGMAFFVVTDIALGLSHILLDAVCTGYDGFPMGLVGGVLQTLHEHRLLPLSDCLFQTPVIGPGGAPVDPFNLAATQFLGLLPDITYSPALLLLAVSAFPWPGVQRDDLGVVRS